MAKYFTHGPDNVDELLASTASHWIQTDLEDQVFNQTPLLKKLYEKKKTANGGASLLIPLLTDTNSTATWYSGYDILDTTPQGGMTTAQAKWKNLAGSITISGEELRQNSGKEAIFNLLDAKTMQCELTLKKQLTAALFAASTPAKQMNSLVTMIDATSTVHDINSTANSFWQATSTASGSFASQGLTDLRTLWTTLDKVTPDGAPDILVTTDTIYNFYEGSLTPQIRYTSDSTGNNTFETLKFKTATMFYDSQATSGVIYMFPSKNLFIVLNSNADFKKTEFVKPTNQDAKTAQILTMLELVTNARRKLGKLTGITA